MSDYRNATASWSWYLHQWKVGIFVALKEIARLQGKWQEIDNWIIIYENAEDFDIQEFNWTNFIVKSRHQIKANKDKNSLNDYKSVIEKTIYWNNWNLETGFEIKKAIYSDKFLHVIKEVNWFYLKKSKFKKKFPRNNFIENYYNIKLYTYWKQKYCDLSLDNNYLKDESLKLIKKIRQDHDVDDDIYLEILFKLDEEIRDKHLNGWCPELSFKEIVEIINNYTTFDNKDESRLRESFVKFYIEYKQELEEEWILITKEEKLNDILIEKIYCSKKEIFFQFLRNIHTDRHDIINSSNDSNICSVWLKSVFYEWIFNIKSKYLFEDLWYIINNENYLLTTITYKKESHVSKSIIENWKITTELFEWNFIINENINWKLDEKIWKLPKYKSINWDIVKYKQLWENLFLNPKKLSFIKINDVINKTK